MFNEKEVRQYYKFLGHIGVSEIRPIKPRWMNDDSLPQSFFVNNEDDFVNQCYLSNKYYNVYVGLNPRDKQGKEDNDVPEIINIGHDIDCHDDINKKIIAGQIAIEIVELCKKHQWQEPLVLDSGRGYWVIHHIASIKNTNENVAKIKEFGKEIKKRFERDGVELDSAVYNPSRIARVPGTINISDKDNPILSKIINEPNGQSDELLKEYILNIKLPEYQPNTSCLNSNNNTTPGIDSFMNYCLTHEIPKGERHRVISRNMAIYLSDNPNREFLKEQYIKIQKGNSNELDQWLKGIDEKGKNSFPYSMAELVKFTKKYKIPFDWKITPEYKQWKDELKAEKNLQEEIIKEKYAEEFSKAIKSFVDKKDLAKQFIKIQPVYFDSARNWWLWCHKELRWIRTDETDILNLIDDVSMANTITSSEKSEIMESLRQEGRKNKPEKVLPTWIQFKDRIYDLETDETFKAQPKYFITNPLPYELNSEEETPIMDKIFREWVGEDNVKTLYEIIAYCMIPSYPINRIFCLVGAGMNGKSKYLELLRKFIGEYNCCSTELDLLIQSRFEVTRLHKKLVCQMGETNFNELTNTSILKKLSGGDLIPFEYKRADLFEDINYAKIIISTNNLPETTDKTIGFYRRWMIVDFPNTFSEKKDILADIPEEEYVALCKKCCKILKSLLEIRTFTNEGTIEERQKRYEDRSNPFDKFFNEYIIESQTYIPKWEFGKRLNEWCKSNRFREMSEIAINKKMKDKGIFDGREIVKWHENGFEKEKFFRVWRNLSWK